MPPGAHASLSTASSPWPAAPARLASRKIVPPGVARAASAGAISIRPASGTFGAASSGAGDGGAAGAVFAIGGAGAVNAGLMAAGILALNDPALAQRLEDWREALSASIPEEPQDD